MFPDNADVDVVLFDPSFLPAAILESSDEAKFDVVEEFLPDNGVPLLASSTRVDVDRFDALLVSFLLSILFESP